MCCFKLFQRRISFNENFARGWSDYKKGFGKASDDYWLGNDLIHALTADHNQIMRWTLTHGKWTSSGKCTMFWIDDETNNYKLTVGGFTGTGMFLSMSYDYNNLFLFF